MAAAGPSPAEWLTLIRNRMSAAFAELPNYTCRETIQRQFRTVKARNYATTGLFRLEVAYLGGRETFAWPGSSRFGEESMADLIPSGFTFSGTFGPFAHEVLSSPAVIFSYRGESSVDGRREVEFQFRMPRETSGFVLRRDERSAVLAYHGFILADPGTGDLIALEVEPDEIPPELQMREVQQTTEYARSRFADAEYLLPTFSQVTILDADGDAYRNNVTFENCREYKGESTVSFTDATDLPAATPPPDQHPIGLPAGLRLVVKTTVPIRRGVTAIGDTVPAVLTEAVRGQMDLPKGAIATLRITRMTSESVGRFRNQIVQFQLLSVETAGKRYEADGDLVDVGSTRYYATVEGGVVFRKNDLAIGPGLILTWRTKEAR